MRLAIILDSLNAYGGAERLVTFFAKKYDIDIYTGYVKYENILPEFKKYNIIQLDKENRIPLLKQYLLMKKFSNLKLSSYDFIISLGAGYSAYIAMKNFQSILYSFGVSPLFYNSGPMDQKYLPYNKVYLRPVNKIWKNYMINKDKYLIQKKFNKIKTISKFTSKCIKNYYNRESEFIGLPVDSEKYKYKKSNGYYLTVDRLIPEKRIDLVVEAFTKMPDKKLFVEGIGPEFNKIKKIAGNSKNIFFLGRVNSNNLAKLYSECIGLISMAYYQDWSMVMVEALASGKPCLGPKQGAYSEIIKEGITGFFVDDNIKGIINGVKRLDIDTAESMKFNCIKKAKNFDKIKFYKKWDKVFKDW